MSITVNASCSECYHQEALELDLRQREIKCEQCVHSVPMLEQDDYYEIEGEQKRQEMMGYMSFAALALALICFYFFISGIEPAFYQAVDLPPEVQEIGGGDQPGGMISGFIMGLAALATIVFGCMASSKKVVCEF